jgi:phosphatidylserine/phosphatidylglycerophosphate/cardiolipin synthase-like enzyme
MSKTTTGRLIDESSNPLPGLRVVVRDESALFSSDLAHDDSKADGTFSVAHGPDLAPDLGTRKLGIFVFTQSRRQLYHDSKDDVSGDVLPLGDITIKQAAATGWVVTLGDSSAALPVRNGNVIRFLIDDEDAWGRVNESVAAAATSVDVMQLEFDMPRAFDSTATQESPEIVLAFGSGIDPLAEVPVSDATHRPERIMLDRAQNGAAVRVVLPTMHINWAIATFDFLLLVVPLLLAFIFDIERSWKLVSLLGAALTGPGGKYGAVKKYFDAAASKTDVEHFETAMFTFVHAKLVMIDDTEAIVLGSPFSQSYWDNHEHNVFDRRRGSASGEPIPVHDVSLTVKGPGVKDMHDAFRLHWNSAKDTFSDGVTTSGSTTLTSATGAFSNADVGKEVVGTNIPPGTTIVSVTNSTSVVLSAPATASGTGLTVTIANVAAISPAPPISSVSDPATESIASVQLVRTLNGGLFPAPLDQGEKGILEGYLRAIDLAEKYIYCENQYFTNDAIGIALVAALNDPKRPNLQVIVMLNVTPDMPLYPVWQSNLIERIRKDAKANANRVGFFTAWTHNGPVTQLGHNKPMIMANYLHSKVGIADDKWATVGSANLDGASLDALEYVRPLQFGQHRNHEANYQIFNGVAGAPATDAVERLRRQLWSEHLGMDASDSRLDLANASTWVASLWKATAEKKRSGLAIDPATIDRSLGRVLEYPTNAKTGLALLLPWVNPERDFLKSSSIGFDNLELMEQVRSFSFHDGKWK